MDTLSSWGVLFRDVANPLPSPSMYYFVRDGILSSAHSCVWVLYCVNALRTSLTDVHSVYWVRLYRFLLFFTLFVSSLQRQRLSHSFSLKLGDGTLTLQNLYGCIICFVLFKFLTCIIWRHSRTYSRCAHGVPFMHCCVMLEFFASLITLPLRITLSTIWQCASVLAFVLCWCIKEWVCFRCTVF